MINRFKSEYQELSESKNVSIEKELVLKIRHVNFGILRPNDWTEVVYKIYKDLSVDIEKTYNRLEQNVESIIKKLTPKDYKSILENIELTKVKEIIVEAMDGSAWEITQYENQEKIWTRELGYIYGIKSLEAVAKVLMKLV